MWFGEFKCLFPQNEQQPDSSLPCGVFHQTLTSWEGKEFRLLNQFQVVYLHAIKWSPARSIFRIREAEQVCTVVIHQKDVDAWISCHRGFWLSGVAWRVRASPRQQVASPPASSGTSLPECHNCARSCGESPKPSGVQRTHTRVPAPQLELFIYFEGRSISDPGIGELRGCSLSLLPGRVHPGGRSLSSGGPAGDWARAGPPSSFQLDPT